MGGLCPCSSDGRQGHVLGAEAAGVQTDTQHSVAATETPTDIQCRVRTVGRSYISRLVWLFVFPGLDSRLIFLFALFPMYEPLILPHTLQRNCDLLPVRQPS